MARLRDQLAAERRALPWVKSRRIMSSTGRRARSRSPISSTAEPALHRAFHDRPWSDQGAMASAVLRGADHVEGALVHLANHESLLCRHVARAPIEEIEADPPEVGSAFTWVSVHGSDFDYDFHAPSEPEEVKERPSLFDYARDGSRPRRPLRRQRLLQGREGSRSSTAIPATGGQRRASRRLRLARPNARGRDERPLSFARPTGCRPRPCMARTASVEGTAYLCGGSGCACTRKAAGPDLLARRPGPRG